MDNRKSIFQRIYQKQIEGIFLKTVLEDFRRSIDRGIARMTRNHLSKTTTIVKNKIIFMTYQNTYVCNPKYITEEIIRQELPYELIWVTDKNNLQNIGDYPQGVKVVERDSFEFFRQISSAHIWIDNAMNYSWEFIPKKRQQYYIQTWHGSMGLKRIGAKDNKDHHWNRVAKKLNKITNLCISNSKFETEVYKNTYWADVKCEELGHPRNDILLNDEPEKIKEIRAKLYKFYGINTKANLLLYAPTFRDTRVDGTRYDFDFEKVLEAVSRKFGGTWVLLKRHHFKMKEIGEVKAGSKDIIDVTEYNDMQELLLVSTCGITDYSSWICDYVLTGKPGFLYVPDLEDYCLERGFYYPLETTPFPIAQNNIELVAKILEFDEEAYRERAKEFLRDRGCVEDGKASQKIVEKIKGIVELEDETK